MTKFAELDQSDTQAAFADLVGVDRAVVSRLMSNGTIAKGGTVRQWLDAYLRSLRAAASGRGDVGEDGGELTRARIREANAKAHKAEVETARELGLLVYVPELEPALRNWAARGALALEGAQRRIIDGIRSEFAVPLEDRHVADHLRAAQRDIAAYASVLGRTVVEGEVGMAAAGDDPDHRVCGVVTVSGSGDE